MSARLGELDWALRLRTLFARTLQSNFFAEEKLPPGARQFDVVQSDAGFTFKSDGEEYRWDCSEMEFRTFSKERLTIPESGVYCRCPKNTFRRLCESADDPYTRARLRWIGPPHTTTIQLESVGDFDPTLQRPPVALRLPPVQTHLHLVEPPGGSIGGALIEIIESDLVLTSSGIVWLFLVAGGEGQCRVRSDEGVHRVWRWSDAARMWATDWT